ncbi:tellurite resistance/C4-dicarboxylate transporter family protein [Phenylobacterium sp.]|uniref:tellurite resistance/C4-dicarboxylate transporter family protein n=1 Tax=Phenylobacterium sp. TaxID=1871053 RepID=UPI00260A65AB|nr:tellurite resistance/C4-dicarboxylate transporter family protein [Phenylobacterium sp.]
MSGRVGLAGWLDREAADLYPGSFALVMATGIISNTLWLEGFAVLSRALFAVVLAAYPSLCALMAVRLVRHWPKLWADLVNPRLVFAFFTLVAASDVFGVGLDLRGYAGAAAALWVFALVVWTLLVYVSFGVLTFRNTAQGANVVHGGWLIAIVGTQSLVILGARIIPEQGALAPSLFVLIHMLWGVGLAFYGIFITLFCYRIFFFEVGPEDVTPLLWVVMGAAAISTNAGSMLILTRSGVPFLVSMRPFIDGVTLIMWIWATWWIPMLVLFGLWKHGLKRVPLSYTPMLWSLVFPLGMYALASLRLGLAAEFAPLRRLAETMVWVALAAWALTAIGLVAAVWARARRLVAPVSAR